MAKITIVGNAVVVTSSLKFEDLVKVAKCKPAALHLKDEKGEKDVFAIGVTDGVGSLTSVGVLFDGATRDDNGFATITMATRFEGSNEEMKEAVADEFGGALASLAKLEATIPAVVEEINNARAEVMEQIQFCD